MPRSIDQVQVVYLAVPCLVAQGSGLRLDRDTAFAFDIHRIEHLGFHFAIGQTAAKVDDAIGQGRFAVVDVRDDGEISNVIHCYQ